MLKFSRVTRMEIKNFNKNTARKQYLRTEKFLEKPFQKSYHQFDSEDIVQIDSCNIIFYRN